METVRLSSKGQFVIPKAIRDRHHWAVGMEFVVVDRGAELVLTPAKAFPAAELESPEAPSVYHGPPLSLDDLDRAVLEEARKHR